MEMDVKKMFKIKFLSQRNCQIKYMKNFAGHPVLNRLEYLISFWAIKFLFSNIQSNLSTKCLPHLQESVYNGSYHISELVHIHKNDMKTEPNSFVYSINL